MSETPGDKTIKELEAQIREDKNRIERLSDLCDADHEILSELLASLASSTAMFTRTPNFDAKDKTPPGYPEREPYPGAYRRGGALETFAALRRFVIKRFGYSRDIAPLDAMCFLMMNADIGFYDPLGDPKFFDNRTRKRRSSASYQEMYYDAFLIHVMDVTIAAIDVHVWEEVFEVPQGSTEMTQPEELEDQWGQEAELGGQGSIGDFIAGGNDGDALDGFMGGSSEGRLGRTDEAGYRPALFERRPDKDNDNEGERLTAERTEEMDSGETADSGHPVETDIVVEAANTTTTDTAEKWLKANDPDHTDTDGGSSDDSAGAFENTDWATHNEQGIVIRPSWLVTKLEPAMEAVEKLLLAANITEERGVVLYKRLENLRKNRGKMPDVRAQAYAYLKRHEKDEVERLTARGQTEIEIYRSFMKDAIERLGDVGGWGVDRAGYEPGFKGELK